jgi:uncharacterized phosphatase
MKRLYYIRHGQSEANVAEIFAGLMDTPLTELGKRQALAAASEIAKIDTQLIVSSPLIRAHETAKIIANGIGYPVADITLNDLFVERDYGPLTGQPWGSEPDLPEAEGVESMEALAARAAEAYQYLQTLPQDVILVVAHGSLWRALRTAIHPETAELQDAEPGNAEVVELI